jgi:NADPH:quinone reductase-like Zn-dependent oxidoreductase
VVVQVHACSVNPTDWKQRKGTLSTMCPLSLPCVLGIDLAGKVMRAGEQAAEAFSEGEEVFGRQTLDRMRVLNGSYAEYCIVEGADIYKKPSSLSMEEAAAVPHASLAAYAALARVGRLHEKRKQKDKAVLVLGGSGGVGTYAVQLAKRHFDCFTVASCSAANAEFVRSLGADEVLDYQDPLFLMSGGLTKFDVIVDCVGGDDYFKAFKGALTHDGVYVTLVGNTRYLADSKTVDWTSVLEVRADYLVRQISCKIGAAENYHILTGSQLNSHDLRIIASLIDRRTLSVVIDSAYSLYDIVQAHERSETHRAKGKIVVKIFGARKGETPHVTSPLHATGGQESAPLHRSALRMQPAPRVQQAPRKEAPPVERGRSRSTRSLGAVGEDQDGVSSEGEEEAPKLLPKRLSEGEAHTPPQDSGKGGVVIDEAWQMPNGGKKGVTYDHGYRPPGVDSPGKTPAESPRSPPSPGGALSVGSSSARTGRNVSDLMPPSLSRDDDVLGPSSALMGVGVRPGELAQRSGSSRGGAARMPDGAWNATLAAVEERSAPPAQLQRPEKSVIPAPIGSPRSVLEPPAEVCDLGFRNYASPRTELEAPGGWSAEVPPAAVGSRKPEPEAPAPRMSRQEEEALGHFQRHIAPSADASPAHSLLASSNGQPEAHHSPVRAVPPAPPANSSAHQTPKAPPAPPHQHPGLPQSEDVEDLTGEHRWRSPARFRSGCAGTDTGTLLDFLPPPPLFYHSLCLCIMETLVP